MASTVDDLRKSILAARDDALRKERERTDAVVAAALRVIESEIKRIAQQDLRLGTAALLLTRAQLGHEFKPSDVPALQNVLPAGFTVLATRRHASGCERDYCQGCEEGVYLMWTWE
jgi:hypothetical protein